VRARSSEADLRELDARVAVGVGYLTAFLLGAWVLILGLRIAGSITQERGQDTLQALLTMPVERTEILNAKWLGNIFRFGGLGYCLMVIWLFSLLAGCLHPLSFLCLLSSCVIYLTFVALIGLWISLVSRSTLWANLTMILALMLSFSGPIVLRAFTYSQSKMAVIQWLRDAPPTLVNPAAVVLSSAFSWQALGSNKGENDTKHPTIKFSESSETELRYRERQRREMQRSLAMIPVNLAVFGALAGIFWWLSRREFKKTYS
jgi:ABC-type Na+ efflux pump permease subunit